MKKQFSVVIKIFLCWAFTKVDYLSFATPIVDTTRMAILHTTRDCTFRIAVLGQGVEGLLNSPFRFGTPTETRSPFYIVRLMCQSVKWP